VFLASDVLLFGGLFSAYFMLRAGSITWGWSPHRHLAIANTVNLLTSTVCFAAAIAAARDRRISQFRQLTWIGLVLGVIFLGVKAYEYQDDLALALYPRTSTRIGLYYLLTAVHAAHVVGGLIVSGRLVLARAKDCSEPAGMLVNRAEAALLYWAFLTIVWVIIVLLFYVW
jgi:heme/copper-type cytochrome/quinol oxidase subunit 3